MGSRCYPPQAAAGVTIASPTYQTDPCTQCAVLHYAALHYNAARAAPQQPPSCCFAISKPPPASAQHSTARDTTPHHTAGTTCMHCGLLPSHQWALATVQCVLVATNRRLLHSFGAAVCHQSSCCSGLFELFLPLPPGAQAVSSAGVGHLLRLLLVFLLL